METIEIEVISWGKHQPRKDIKHPSWFALSNRIMEDPKLFGLTADEWKALLYIFCQASQQNSPKIRLNLAHAFRICEIPENSLRSAIKKLAYAGVIVETEPRTPAYRDTTLQDTTNNTLQDTTVPATLPRTRAPKVESELSRSIWKSYREAYSKRYGTDPVRNASVNSQIKKVGERLGEEAVEVVRYFVTHNNAFYVRSLHKIGLCLIDAESLRTQWATGTQVTAREANNTDSAGAVASQLKRIREGRL